MQGKTAIVILITLIVGLSTIHASSNDGRVAIENVTFESSDGIWMDFTDNFKGRTFADVLYTFEKYRLLENKPDVTLLRVTQRTPESKDCIEWKVPFARSGGGAKPFLRPLTAKQREEISRRAQAALAYWQSK